MRSQNDNVLHTGIQQTVPETRDTEGRAETPGVSNMAAVSDNVHRVSLGDMSWFRLGTY